MWVFSVLGFALEEESCGVKCHKYFRPEGVPNSKRLQTCLGKYDATKMELDQINEYQAFIDHGIAKYDPKSKRVMNAPQGYQKIMVHLVLPCKNDGHRKARLVAGGHLASGPIDSIYSGVVSTRSLRLSIFLAKLNDMEVWGADIGNAYLEATTKENLYIVAGPDFVELQGHILKFHKAV